MTSARLGPLSLLEESSRRPALDSVDTRETQVALGKVCTRMFGTARGDSPRRRGLARYRLVRRIGSGGMGVVYEAWDPELGRAVAIKRLRAGLGSRTECRRVVREGQTMAQLDHPNVAQVFDVALTPPREADDPAAFIVMELVRGQSLRSWLEHERSVPQILGVFEQAARGLAAVHRAGLLHRDFKPDNVIVSDGPRGPKVRVVDFGLCVAHEDTSTPGRSDTTTSRRDASDPTCTPSDPLAGTPLYMAPEQLAGCGATIGSDIYAYCVTLYIALLGAQPHAGTTRGALLSAKLTMPPSFEGRRRLPGSVAELLRRGLSPSSSGRPHSMEEIVRCLERARARPGGARWKVATATLVTTLLTTLLVLATRSIDRAKPPSPRIERGEIALSAAEGWLKADRPQAALATARAVEDAAGADTRMLAPARLVAGLALTRLDDLGAAEQALSGAYFDAIAAGESETALRAALGLCRVSLGTGRLLDGRWWIDAAQPLLDRAHRPPGLAAELLLCRADAAAHTGDAARAHALTHQAVRLLERDDAGDAATHVDRLLRVATYEITGEHAQAAWTLAQLANRIARHRLGAGRSQVRARAQMAYAAIHLGRAEHAVAIYDELLDESNAGVSADQRVRMLNNRAALHRGLGDLDAAAADVRAARDALTDPRVTNGHPLQLAVATNDAANLLAQQRPVEALELLIPLQVALESSVELPVHAMQGVVRKAIAQARGQLRAQARDHAG